MSESKMFNISNEFFKKIYEHPELHRRDFRILFLLMSKSRQIDNDVITVITQKQIGLLLGDIDNALISKSIGRLIKSGVLEKIKADPRIDFAKGFKINL